MKKTFKIGDKVKLIANSYPDRPKNPIWGGVCGEVVGTIISVYRPAYIAYYHVKWENKERNNYRSYELGEEQ